MTKYINTLWIFSTSLMLGLRNAPRFRGFTLRWVLGLLKGDCCVPQACKPSIGQLKDWKRGLPWWCSGWESSYQCRGHQLDPWSGKIPRAPGHKPRHRNCWACVQKPPKPTCLEAALCDKRCSEKPANHNEEKPLIYANIPRPMCSEETQRNQKKKLNKKRLKKAPGSQRQRHLW